MIQSNNMQPRHYGPGCREQQFTKNQIGMQYSKEENKFLKVNEVEET